MGVSFSMFLSIWNELWEHKYFSLLRTVVSGRKNNDMGNEADSLKKEESDSKNSFDDSERLGLEKTWEMKEGKFDDGNVAFDRENLSLGSSEGKLRGSSQMKKPTLQIPPPATLFSPKPESQLDAAATKVQKVYKSYRTRRNLADCAVAVEELWWKTLDSAFSFLIAQKPWPRAKRRAATVGKGLSKDEKAQKLALQHWLEAIDPRHRYGRNLHLYYDVWFASHSTQHFFYWLDIGDGKDLSLDKCPRAVLQRQCIKYLGPKEREAYEVIVANGKLIYKQSRMPVNTVGDSKWIFVLSPSRALYVGQKKKGEFQHSSFLSGAATTAAGRLIAYDGILKAVWPYSGHYRPTEDHFKEFISYLQEKRVDLTNVKLYAIDYESSSSTGLDENPTEEETEIQTSANACDINEPDGFQPSKEDHDHEELEASAATFAVEEQVFALPDRLSCKWTSGVGPRIGCLRDYPADLQSQALEQVNLSPKDVPRYRASDAPIPSPRPSPSIRVSPRLAYMGLPTPSSSSFKINGGNLVQSLSSASHAHGYGKGS